MKKFTLHIIFSFAALFLTPGAVVFANNCLNMPDNQTDLQQMMYDNIIKVRVGTYNPPNAANPSSIIGYTDVNLSSYVNVRNGIYEQDPNISPTLTIENNFNSSVRIGPTQYIDEGSITEFVKDISLDPKHPILNFHICAVLVKGQSLSQPERSLHGVKITFIGNDGSVFDETCYAIKAFSWERYNSTEHYYIKWTSLSVDLSAVINDVKKVRIWNLSPANTPKAYSYSYVIAQCIKKEINHTIYCGEHVSTTNPVEKTALIAPEGFRWAWYENYSNLEMGITYALSQSQTINIGDPNKKYTLCYWTPGTDSIACYNTLHFFSTARWPIPDFVVTPYKDDECGDKIVFSGRSYIATTSTGMDGSMSSRVEDMPGEQPEKTHWRIESADAGFTKEFDAFSADTTFSMYFSRPGTYNVTVTAELSVCSKSLTKSFTVTNPRVPDTTYIYQEQCSGNYFVFNGQRIYTSGTYTQNLTTKNGCDSIVVLVYNKLNEYHIYEYDTIHYNTNIHRDKPHLEKYGILDAVNAHTGTYEVIGTTKAGCDSICTLFLYVYPYKVFETIDSICVDLLPYVWNGKSYGGIPSNPAPSPFMSTDDYFTRDTDFTEILTLYILPVEDVTNDYYICTGQTVKINGETISHDTVIETDGYLPNGCKHKVIHRVHQEQPVTIDHGVVRICKDDVFEWKIDERHTKNLSTPGVHYYHRPLTNPEISSCDTIDFIRIIHLNTYYQKKSLFVCPKDSTERLEDGKRHAAGDFDIVVNTIDGCDSILQYHVRERKMSVDTAYVQLCSNQTFQINGTLITKSDTYRDTFLSSHGCFDSVVVYYVTVRPIHHDTVHIRLCQNEEAFKIRDGVVVHMGYSTLTEYTDTVYDRYGCDSIRTYLVTQGVSHIYEETRVVCDDGQGITWRGKEYFTTGIYSDTVHPAKKEDCDTIYILNLRKAPIVYESPKNISICKGDTIIYEGVKYYDEGEHLIKSHSRFGCDSFIQLRIRHLQTYYYVLRDTICEGDIYTFNGRSLLQPVGDSTYYNRYTAVSGCDSIYELRLHVLPSHDVLIYDTICNGDYYQLGDRYLSRTGIYTYDCVSSITGCDSMTTVALTVMPNFVSETLHVYLCDDSVYHFGDTLLRTAGVYSRHYTTRYGCDSVRYVQIERGHSYYKADTVTICQGERYYFCGKEYDKTGVYSDSSHTLHGQCDSIHVLNLIVNPSYHTDTVRVQLCADARYILKNRELDPSDTPYDDHNYTLQGCDSIVTYIINRGNTYIYEYPSVHICSDSLYEWTNPKRVRKVRAGGTYSDTIHSSSVGCDSIYRIHIYSEDIKKTSKVAVICPGDSIYFGGVMIKDTGIYRDTLPSYPYGCDSIVQLHLFHYAHYYHEKKDTICANEVYWFNGRIVNQDSTYIDRFPTADGCDSVFKLILHVSDTNIYYTSDTICEGTLYHFGDTTLRTSGTYRYKTKNKDFCDSTTILQLTVMPNVETSEIVYICENSSYTHRKSPGVIDTVITTPGSYHRHFKTQFGCDSTHVLFVRMDYAFHHYDTAHICYGESYTFHGKEYSTSGDFTYEEKTYYGRCDSVYHLHLTVTSVYRHDTTRITLCPGSTFSFKGHTLTPPAEYVDSNLTVANCDSIHWYIINEGVRYERDTTATMCDTQSVFRWYPNRKLWPNVYKDVSEDGTYDYTFKSSLGMSACDTVYRLHMHITRSKHSKRYKTICPTDSVKFAGRYVSAVGSYFDTLTYFYEPYGGLCDSIDELVISHYPQYSFSETHAICDNGSYMFNGRLVYWDSTYVDSFHTVLYGCDSIYTLRLHVSKRDTVYLRDTICEGDVHLFGDSLLRTTGTYSYWTQKRIAHPYDDKLHCDSLTVLQLEVLPSIRVDTNIVDMCYGDTVFIDDAVGKDTITNTGTYIRRLVSHYGCDSMRYYHVYFSPVYNRFDTVVLCDGEQYMLPSGRYVSEATTYDDTVKSILTGCDSISHITLIYHHRDFDTVRVNACFPMNLTRPNGEVLLVDYGQSKSYNDSFLNVHSCDSIITYIVSVNTSSLNMIEYPLLNLCQGQVVNWDTRRSYSSYGRDHHKLINGDRPFYYDTIKASNEKECDTIYIQPVEVHPTYHFKRDTIACPSLIIYLANKKNSDGSGGDIRVDGSGIYESHLSTKFDCDCTIVWNVQRYAIYDTSLNISLCQGEKFTISYTSFEGGQLKEVTESFDKPKDTIIKASTHYGCDSIIRLHITVHPKYDKVVNHYLCPNQTLVLYDSLVYKNTGKDISTDNLNVKFNTVHGCDSVIHHRINYLPNYLFDSVMYVCANSVVKWHGRELTKPGIYYDSLTTNVSATPVRPSCDSVYRLDLRHRSIQYRKREAYICSNEYFDLQDNGKRLVNTDGIYKDTFTTYEGCDSIVETHLRVYHTFFKEDSIELCDNDSFWTSTQCIFPRDILQYGDSSHDFYDSLLTVGSLCDSIRLYHVRLRPTFRDTIDVRLCPNETYVIRDNIVLHSREKQESYEYLDTLMSMNFCDSINVYRIVSLENTYHTEERWFCSLREDIDFIWEVGNDPSEYVHVTSPGTYEKRYIGKNNCDSIERLKVRYYDVPVKIEFDTICPKEHPHVSHYWNGYPTDTAGVYIDTVSGDDCDTIAELHLTYWPTYVDTIYDTICDNQYYYIAGQAVTSKIDTVFRFELSTIHGCDSSVILFLSVIPSYFSIKNYDVCPNKTIKIRNKFITLGLTDTIKPRIYNDTMNSHQGCDSIEQYIITVHPSYMFLTDSIRCVGTSIKWTDIYGEQRIISEPGVYADTFRTTLCGCDSIVGIRFMHAPSYDVHIYDTVWCSNDDYVWRNNKRYTESGEYKDTLRSMFGCDSIITLHLTMFRPYLMRKRDSICEFERYWFRGHFYNKSGIYYDSMKTWAGCDSIYMLELRVVPIYRDTTDTFLCVGKTMMWGNNLCSSDGVYYDTINTPGELFCQIRVLYINFITEKDSRVYFDSIADVCADGTSFDIYSRYKGYRPKYFCLFYDQKGKDQGFKDVMYREYREHLTFAIPKRLNNSYVYPDWYTVTFKAIYDECSPDVDEYQIRFRVLYPSWIIEQNWGDVVALLNSEHNGGFTFDNYIWYVNDRMISTANDANLYMKELGVGDQVYLVPTRLGEDYAIPTCPITIRQYIDSSEYRVPILIYPTTVARINARVNLESKISGHYTIFDMYGHKLAHNSYTGGKLVSVPLPDISGCYLLYVETEDGKKKSTKIMVY